MCWKKWALVALVLVGLLGFLWLTAEPSPQTTFRLPPRRECPGSGDPTLQGTVDANVEALASEGRTAKATEIPRFVRLVDYSSGSPVSGVQVALGSTAAGRLGLARVQVSDKGGYVPVPAAEIGTLHLAAGHWTSARGQACEWQTFDQDPNCGVWRLFRLRTLSGRVVYDGLSDGGTELPAATFRLDAPAHPGDTEEGVAGNTRMHWLTVHGLKGRLPSGAVHVDESGRFSMQVPPFAGLFVVVSSPGWTPGSAVLEYYPDGEPVPVVLTLRRPPEVRVRVLSSSGQPLPDLEVQVFLVNEDKADAYLAQMAFVDGWRTSHLVDNRSKKRSSSATAKYRTDVRGEFAFPVHATPSRALLVAYPEGHRPLRERLTVTQPSTQVVRAAVSEGDQITLTGLGQDLQGTVLVLHDATEQAAQATARIPVGIGGRVRAEWFERGHAYLLVVERSGEPVAAGHVRWNGQEVIDMTALASSLGDV